MLKGKNKVFSAILTMLLILNLNVVPAFAHNGVDDGDETTVSEHPSTIDEGDIIKEVHLPVESQPQKPEPRVTKEQAAQFLQTKGMLQGDKGNLMLDQKLTREQMMVIISRLLGVENEALKQPLDKMTFKDVTKDDWAAPYVAWAQKNNITQGYSPEKFGLGDELTGWQTKAFFVRALGYKDTSDDEIENKAEQLGITVGTSVDSNQPIVRADVALLMYNALDDQTAQGGILGDKLSVQATNTGDSIRQGDTIYYKSKENGLRIYKKKIGEDTGIPVSKGSAQEMVLSGDWLYYVNGQDNFSLNKVKIDGKGETKINDDMSSNIVVNGEWIYFRNDSDGSRLYKIKTDGSQKTKLSEFDASHFEILGDWIYYISDSEGKKLLRIKMDGTNEVPVNYSNDLVQVSNGWVYYIKQEFSNKIFKVKETGQDKTELNVYSTGGIKLDGDWILFNNALFDGLFYKTNTNDTSRRKLEHSVENSIVDGNMIYFNTVDESSLCKITIDGTDRVEIVSTPTKLDSLTNGFLYYIDQNDGKLYRISIEGKDKQQITDSEVFGETIVGGWIYYNSYRDNKFYKVKLDGSQKTKLSDTTLTDINVSGNWIYGTDGISRKIIKISLNGDKIQAVSDDQGLKLVVAGDWIYYSNLSDGYKLYKVKIDGTSRTKLTHDPSVIIKINGDSIYYKNLEDYERLYKINTAGMGREKLE